MSKEGAEIIQMSDLLSEKIGEDIDRFGDPVEIIGEEPVVETVDEDEPVVEETVVEEAEDEVIEVGDEAAVEDPVVETVDEEGVIEPTGEEDPNEDPEKYKLSMKRLFGEDFKVVQTNEKGEDVELGVDDLDLDQDGYTDMVESIMTQREAEIKEGMIASDSMSTFAKDLIELEKIGGDVTEMLKVKAEITDPLANIDISTKEGQKEMIKLRMTISGQQSEGDIKRLISSYEKEGILDEMSETAEQELKGAIQRHGEETKNAAKVKKQKRESTLKKYKEKLKESLSGYQIEETVKKKVAKMATDMNEKGEFKIDDAYFKFRSDPDKAAKLALLILDEELFIKEMTNKAVKREKLSNAKTYVIKQKGSASTPRSQGKGDIGKKDDTFSIADLNGGK